MTRRRHIPVRHIPAWRNPVAKAVSIRRMDAAQLSERIQVLMLVDGEPATEELAHLGWMIAVACETAMHALGLHHPTSRTLHGALRAIEAMCLRNGYRWDASQALAIEAARTAAHQVLIDHPAIGGQHTDAGHILAGLIQGHRLVPGMLAGAEIYSQQEATQP